MNSLAIIILKIWAKVLCVNISGGGFNNVLVIGADALSRYVDWNDRGSCILFGDAAGAVLLQVNPFHIFLVLFLYCFNTNLKKHLVNLCKRLNQVGFVNLREIAIITLSSLFL